MTHCKCLHFGFTGVILFGFFYLYLEDYSAVAPTDLATHRNPLESLLQIDLWFHPGPVELKFLRLGMGHSSI